MANYSEKYTNISNLVDEEVAEIDMIDPYSGEINLHSFEPKDELNQDLFDGDELRKEVLLECLYDADDFIEWCGLTYKDIDDIVLVGSSVSYHYSSFSDIDIHIIVNMENIDSDIDSVNANLMEKRFKWSMEHELTIKGYEVELFVQDVSSINVSAGIYSLKNKRWLKVPTKEGESFDRLKIEQKSLEYVLTIDGVEDWDKEGAQKLLDEIHEMRARGLESDSGELSEENIIFKVLRRTGHLKKLKKIAKQNNIEMNKQFENEVYDIAKSVTERLRMNESNVVSESSHDGFEDWGVTNIYDVRNFVEFVIGSTEQEIKNGCVLLKDLFLKCRGLNDSENAIIDDEVWDNIASKIKLICTSVESGNENNFAISLDGLRGIIKNVYPFNSPDLPVEESASISYDNSLNEWRIGTNAKKHLATGLAGFLLGVGVSQFAANRFNNDVESDMSVETIIGDTTSVDTQSANVATVSTPQQTSHKEIKASQEIKDFIKGYETCKLVPYVPGGTEEAKKYNKVKHTNNVGKTVGWGHKIKESDPEWLKSPKCTKITQEQADKLFDDDVKEFEGYLKKHIARLPGFLHKPETYTQGMIDAMFSLEWNMGPTGFSNSPFYKSLGRCRYDKETKTFNKSDYDCTLAKIKSSGISDPGHTPRRNAEYNIARGGEYNHIH